MRDVSAGTRAALIGVAVMWSALVSGLAGVGCSGSSEPGGADPDFGTDTATGGDATPGDATPGDATPGDATPGDPSSGAIDAGSGQDSGGGADVTGVAVAPTLASLKLSASGTELTDELGRLVLLRGANTGGRAKFPPFHPFPFAESGLPEQSMAPGFDQAVSDYFARMASWGLNVARMPFTWEALEPQRDAFDEGFLDRYVAQIDAAAAHGIRVIVDFHQDVYARPFCGDGFPVWTIAEPVPETPEDCSSWFMGYLFDDGQKAAFDRFWADEDNLRGEFKDMWEHMATRTWARPNVIGFEIINEPGSGSADDTVWGPQVLTPFYTELGAHIRSHAPDALVFFDSTGLDAVTQETAVELPDGEGWVFAPHFYDPTVFMGAAAGGDFNVLESLGRWAAKRDAWGVPLIVGEFGIEAVDPGAVAYIRDNFDAMDVYQLHGTVWEYSSTVDDWNDEGMSVVAADGTDTPVIDAVTRAYPAAVAGALEAWTWDAATLAGELRFTATAGGVTELVAPARLYPDGVQVTLSGVEGCWSLDVATGRVIVHALEAGAAVVTLAPAASE